MMSEIADKNDDQETELEEIIESTEQEPKKVSIETNKDVSSLFGSADSLFSNAPNSTFDSIIPSNITSKPFYPLNNNISPFDNPAVPVSSIFSLPPPGANVSQNIVSPLDIFNNAAPVSHISTNPLAPPSAPGVKFVSPIPAPKDTPPPPTLPPPVPHTNKKQILQHTPVLPGSIPTPHGYAAPLQPKVASNIQNTAAPTNKLSMSTESKQINKVAPPSSNGSHIQLFTPALKPMYPSTDTNFINSEQNSINSAASQDFSFNQGDLTNRKIVFIFLII